MKLNAQRVLAADCRIAAFCNVDAGEAVPNKSFFARAFVGSRRVDAGGIVTASVERSVAAFVQVNAPITAIANVTERTCVARACSAFACVSIDAFAKE